MSQIQTIIDDINQKFTSKTEVRDQVLQRSRELIRHCANTIRATHRGEVETATSLLAQADELAAGLRQQTAGLPDIYFAGYTQDALKEFAEAHLTFAFITDAPLPSHQTLQVEEAAYLNGLAETVGELRRYALDALRRSDIATSEKMLNLMDDIYTGLTTCDFPAAITGGLRRSTDVARSILERTRGDVTNAIRQEAMTRALAQFEERVSHLQ